MGKKHWVTPLNLCIQIPVPQVYKVKHLAMQSAFPSICEAMHCSKRLTEFKYDAIIGLHHCKKSVCEICSLPDIPKSAVSGIIAK